MTPYLASQFWFSIPALVPATIYLLASAILLSTRTARQDRPSCLAVLGAAVLILVALSYSYYAFTIDDAYISLRYARNLASGHGLVFSADGTAPVEGYTNFLWVVLESALFLLNLQTSSIVHAIKIIGILFGAGVVLGTYTLIRIATDDGRLAALGALLLGSVPQLSFWAVGGLETTMYMFWLVLGINFYLYERRLRAHHAVSMVSFLLMSLTRPEGVFFVGLLVSWELLNTMRLQRGNERTSSLQRLLSGVAIFAVGFGAYFAWRYGYYGFILPNTFYARSGAVGVPHIARRLREMTPFLAYLLPLAGIAWFGCLRRWDTTWRGQDLFVFSLVVLFGFCFAPRREWMPGFRYELPLVPILVCFVSLGIGRLFAQNGGWDEVSWDERMRRYGLVGCLGGFILFAATGLHQEVRYSTNLERAHVALGKWLHTYAPGDASYAGWDMGAVPFYSELPSIIDIHPEGILNTDTTHRGYDVAHTLSLKPSFLVLPTEPRDGVYPQGSMSRFYLSPVLGNEYGFLCSVYFTTDYVLTVYKRKDVPISGRGLDEARLLQKRSRAEALRDTSH